MCRSQQVNEVAEELSSSEEECNLIRCFDSCDDFEIMVVEEDIMSVEQIEDHILDKFEKRRNQNVSTRHGSLQNVRKIDIRRNIKSEQIKSLKALVRIDNQIFNLTIDTRSPVSFLNRETTKQFLEECPKTPFIPAENQNLSADFVDYNKQTNLILGALKVDISSVGWEVKGLSCLVDELRTRCILGLDLQSKVGIHTTQRTAPTEKSRFDVLLCEQSQGWKKLFYAKFLDVFECQSISKNHVVSTKLKYSSCSIQEKGRRIPNHIQDKVQPELTKLLSEGYIKKLDKGTSDCFIAPIVITVKKDDSIKLALDAKPINRQLFKNKNQMPNVDELLDGVSQIVTENALGTCISKS